LKSPTILSWGWVYSDQWDNSPIDSNGNGGNDYINLNSKGVYVRLYCVKSNAGSGFSLKEFEVYGEPTVNRPPSAIVCEDIEMIMPVQYDFPIDAWQSRDPDNDMLVFNWKQISGPTQLILTKVEYPFATAMVSSTNYIAGVHKIELTVSDGLSTTKDTLTITFIGDLNIALNKPVVVSSIENSNYSGPKVNDGNISTRWSSTFSNLQYVQINLGMSYQITKVVLKWEAASAKKYKIQVSNNGIFWQTIKSESNGDGGTDIIDIGEPINAVFIRMYGETRNTAYGYSLYEFEVYGTPKENSPPVINFYDNEKILFTPESDFAIYYSVNDADGNYLLEKRWKQISGPSCTMTDVWTEGDNLLVTDYTSGDYLFELTASDGLLSVSNRVSATVDNLAYGKPCLSSTQQDNSICGNVVDGKKATFWISAASDPQWVQVDLQKNYILKNVVLKWGTTYAKSYRIETSPDGTTWKSIISNTTGKGGLEDLKASGTARYIRMYGLSRSSSAEYSLAEFEVFGIEDKGAPIGSVVTFKAVVNNKYVCAENYGNNPLIANRATAGSWEKFKVVDAGNGNIGLQALINNKYVTADNYGNASLIAKATIINTWEKFQWVNNIDGTASLKALVNGKYVTAENYGNSPLIARASVIDTWEKFNIGIIENSPQLISTDVTPGMEVAPEISVYPNPANDILHIDLGEVKGIASISIYDLDGRLLYQKQTAWASNEVDVAGFKTSGLIIIKVTNADRTTILKAVIQN
jgi:hypothetical protein